MKPTNDYLKTIQRRLTPLIESIEQHPLYQKLNSVERWQCFMEHDVFTTWDYMCLLKALYEKMGCVTVPWFPPEHSDTALFIQKIMSTTESDRGLDGEYHASHFEWYLQAMREANAHIIPMQNFLDYLKKEVSLVDALGNIKAPDFIQEFVSTTFLFCEQPMNQIVAAFVFGREMIANTIATRLFEQLKKLPCKELEILTYYFQRQIELNTEIRLAADFEMLVNLCQQDLLKWWQVEVSAQLALRARLELFDGILEAVEKIK